MGDFLIEPSPVIVEQVDKASTQFDAVAREPVKTVRRSAAIELEAQVSYGIAYRASVWRGGQGGNVEDASGYLVFEIDDLTAASVVLARGDKVTSIGGIAANVWLTSRNYAAHVGGRPHVEIWNFVDKPLTSRA